MNHSMSNYKRTIVKRTLHSHALDEERSMLVYLPPGYQEIMSYPVIYCQDGEQFFNFGRIATQTTALILEQDMIPPIIVGVEVNASKRNADYHPLGQRHSEYCSFFTEEMLPFIEGEFPVRTTVEDRIIAGDSLGATVSLHLALKHSHLFRKILSLSGAFYEPSQQLVETQSDLSWLQLYMLIGLQEDEVVTDHGTYDFLQSNRQLMKLLEQRGADLSYKEAEGKHLWGFWQKELPEALLYFLKD